MKPLSRVLAALLALNLSTASAAPLPRPSYSDILLPNSGAPAPAPSSGSQVSVASVIGSCTPADRSVLIGGNNSVSDFAVPGNLKNVMALGRTALYASAFAVNNMIADGDAKVPSGSPALGQQIMGTFANTGPGIGEEFYDTYATPDLPGSAHNDGGALNAVNGPAQAAEIGWKPSIMMMNINYTGTTQFLAPGDVTQFQTASADILKTYQSVKYVYPYIDGGSSSDWSASTTYWPLAKSMIQAAGGVGIDVPVGLPFAAGTNPIFLASIVNEIQWANSAGVVTVLLLTPYASSPPSGVLGQFAPDNQFLVNTKRLIEYLKNNYALPSAYVVSNYSGVATVNGAQVTANEVGSDTDGKDPSVAFVARWVAENAPTSHLVPLPAGSEQAGPVPCAAAMANGLPATRVSLGASGLGLGSMAYEDTNNFHLYGGTFYGNPVFTQDMEMAPTKSLALGFGGATVGYVHGDGAGTVTIDPGSASGTVKVPQGGLVTPQLTFDPSGFAPASSSSSGCTPGQAAWDTNYFYICTATNTWKRTALSSY